MSDAVPGATWLALIAAALFSLLLAPSAYACPSSLHMRSIMFEAAPADTSPHDLVLRVSFPQFGQHTEGWVERGYVIDAAAIAVMQGKYDQATVPVVIGFGTCDRTPFGEEGLIIGHFDTALDENRAEQRVFSPRSETVGARFQRGAEAQ